MRKALLIFIIIFSLFLATGCAEKAEEGATEEAVDEGASIPEEGITEEETPVDDVDPVYQNFPSDVDTEEEIPVEEVTEVEKVTGGEVVIPVPVQEVVEVNEGLEETSVESEDPLIEAVTPVEVITQNEEVVEGNPIVEDEPEEGAILAGEVTEEKSVGEVSEDESTENNTSVKENFGKIEFNTPEKMKVGESEIFSAYITGNSSKNISEVTGSNDKFQSRNISVTPKMKVILRGKGEGAFSIEPLTDDVQNIIETTTWKWNVIPQKSGEQTLILHVYLVTYSNNSENIRYLEELKENIDVGVNPSYFFESNWQWITGTIITISIALLGIFWKKK